MGLIRGVLTAPFVVPARGLFFVLEKIRDAAEAELYDEGRVRNALMALELQHDLGEIPDADYLLREAELFKELNAILAYKRAQEPAPKPRRRARSRR
jgi:hypothetical protein